MPAYNTFIFYTRTALGKLETKIQWHLLFLDTVYFAVNSNSICNVPIKFFYCY